MARTNFVKSARARKEGRSPRRCCTCGKPIADQIESSVSELDYVDFPDKPEDDDEHGYDSFEEALDAWWQECLDAADTAAADAEGNMP